MPPIWCPGPVHARGIHPSCRYFITFALQRRRTLNWEFRVWYLIVRRPYPLYQQPHRFGRSEIPHWARPHREPTQGSRLQWLAIIVLPKDMRDEFLQTIHSGHEGEPKCILLARQYAFWPGISSDNRQMVKGCHLCSKQSPAQPMLPIIQPNLPSRPWEKLRTDIFDFNGKKHLTMVYYYSRYPVIRLDRTRLNSQCASGVWPTYLNYHWLRPTVR